MALGGNPVFNSAAFRGAKTPQSAPQRSAEAGSTMMGQLSSEQLQDLYNRPSAGPAQTGRMTYDDVIVKTLGCLSVVLVGAVVGWAFPILLLPGVLVGFVLGLVNSFKREPSPGLILAYAAAEGLFIGGLSAFLEARFPGVALQAVIGTLSVFAVTLLLFRNGKVRATPKAIRFFMIALIGYAVFSLVNLGMMLFGATHTMFGMRDMQIFGIPLGVFVGILAIGLAAFSLIMDFTSIEYGVNNGAPQRYSWTAAFGLTVTLVWLYVEIIRLLAILRGDN
jgi:uncharacterized YccA/Bax inhibitor family protein